GDAPEEPQVAMEVPRGRVVARDDALPGREEAARERAREAPAEGNQEEKRRRRRDARGELVEPGGEEPDEEREHRRERRARERANERAEGEEEAALLLGVATGDAGGHRERVPREQFGTGNWELGTGN